MSNQTRETEQYRLLTPDVPDDAPEGMDEFMELDADERQELIEQTGRTKVVHEANSLAAIVEFIRNDERFDRVPFSEDDADKFREHESFGWRVDSPDGQRKAYTVELV